MDALDTYHHPSGRFSMAGALLALASGLAAGVVFGGVYAYVDVYVPVVGEFSFLLAAALGGGTGVVTGKALKAGLVRNRMVAGAIAALTAAGTLYATWVVYLFALLHQIGLRPRPRALGLHPAVVWHALRTLDVSGAWRMEDSTPTGAVLWAIWLGEAAIVCGLLVFVALKSWGAAPFCEACGSWCAERKGVGTFALGDKLDLVPKLEAKDLSALERLGPATTSPFLRVDLHGCPKCRQTNTLTLERVSVARQANGKTQVATRRWANRLLLTPSEAEQVPQIAARVASKAQAATSSG